METIAQVVTRHLAAGVEDLDQLAELVFQNVGKTPSRRTLADYRKRYRKLGSNWMARERQRSLQWHEANRDRSIEKSRQWKTDNPAWAMLGRCRYSAKRRGQECTITVADIEALLAPMVCSVTGLPLTLEASGSSKSNPWAPSVDRIDGSKGYVPGNIRVVCWAFNMMRCDFPDEVVMTLAEALVRRRLAP